MKRVVSISIGSSDRDFKAETEILGEKYIIERIGTDGNIDKAIEKIKELDGKVDAFGMGGIDIYLTGAEKKFLIKEAIPIMKAASRTPIADGTGVKNILEKRIIEYLSQNKVIDFSGKKVLMTCAIDRYAMTKAFIDHGCEVIMGDIMFSLGIPFPIKSLKTFRSVANILLPIIALMPFKMLYPTGNQQKENVGSKRYEKYYEAADIIAGDYHYIKKYMPSSLKDKIIITNTVTSKDVDTLKKRGAGMLITTMPGFNGRSFGTNVMEATLVAASGKKPEDLVDGDYHFLFDIMGLKPRIERLNELI